MAPRPATPGTGVTTIESTDVIRRRARSNTAIPHVSVDELAPGHPRQRIVADGSIGGVLCNRSRVADLEPLVWRTLDDSDGRSLHGCERHALPRRRARGERASAVEPLVRARRPAVLHRTPRPRARRAERP